MAMSVQAKFMDAAVYKKKGGRGTRERMKSTFSSLEAMAKKGGWGDLTPQNLTHKQLSKWIAARLDEGITAHSVATDVAAIRRAMIGVGRSIDALKIFTSESLGIPSYSRAGTGVAIEPDLYRTAHAKAEAPIAAGMSLQFEIGLRAAEVVSCEQCLPGWALKLRLGRSDLYLTDSGQKGARPRTIYIHPEKMAAALAAVDAALACTENGTQFLIASKNGKSAKALYLSRLKDLGISGHQSSHSMRRRFAVDQYQLYMAAGDSHRLALSKCAMDLGHGDKRGNLVWNSYIKNSL